MTEQTKADDWNDNYPVGQSVRVTFLSKSSVSTSEAIETVTESKAFVFCGVAVLLVRGYKNYVSLERVEAI